MTGFELLKAPGTTVEGIADIVSAPCPPVVPTECDRLSCRECWLVWLTTGAAAKEKGPSDKQTAPDEDGLHPNLVEHLRERLYPVSPLGIVVEGRRYNSAELLAYVGERVSIVKENGTIKAKAIGGRTIGELTLFPL